jgi:D-alanine-D-alanine ligase
MLDLPYVGPGVTASALAMDKVLAKRVMAAAGVPVVDYEATTGAAFEADPRAFLALLSRLPLPLFVKPSVGGSSVGVKKVDSRACQETSIRFALQFDDAVLVERGIVGRELECAVLGYGTLEASVIGEIVPGNDFYDYADKYLEDKAGLIAPADLPEAVAARLRDLAVRACAALGGAGMARVDFLYEEEKGEAGLYVNEINTLPGFTSISMYPRLWSLSGLPLPRLVDRLVQIAVERHRDRGRLDRGIKEFLAELAAR